jgi:hypothetical protein
MNRLQLPQVEYKGPQFEIVKRAIHLAYIHVTRQVLIRHFDLQSHESISADLPRVPRRSLWPGDHGFDQHLAIAAFPCLHILKRVRRVSKTVSSKNPRKCETLHRINVSPMGDQRLEVDLALRHQADS